MCHIKSPASETSVRDLGLQFEACVKCSGRLDFGFVANVMKGDSLSIIVFACFNADVTTLEPNDVTWAWDDKIWT